MVDFLFTHADGRLERVRKRSPVQTKRGAEEHERQLRQSLQAGTYQRKEVAPPPTVAEFSKEFIGQYAVANNKPSEIDSKETVFRNHLVPFFGKLRLDQVGLRELERYKALKIKEEYKPSTINNQLTMLRRMLAVAVEWGLIQFVPKVKWLKIPEVEVDFLSFEEADRLLAHAEGEWKCMMMVGLKAGLRFGELLALRWDDVDLVVGQMVVRRSAARGRIGTPKSGKSRKIPLCPSALAALKAQRHLRGELVFSDSGGELLTKGECKWPLWRACKKAGLRRIGWHTMRHSFASHLVMKGVPLRVVQELLGHATIEMTMRYSHLSPNVPRDAVALLDGHGTYVAPQADLRPNST
ncbi:MAG: site-specific integrase [Deltaproteobacteria bacterium]|nr:site-specific integrase [Deltaproteobacteria bacterium]